MPPQLGREVDALRPGEGDQAVRREVGRDRVRRGELERRHQDTQVQCAGERPLRERAGRIGSEERKARHEPDQDTAQQRVAGAGAARDRHRQGRHVGPAAPVMGEGASSSCRHHQPQGGRESARLVADALQEDLRGVGREGCPGQGRGLVDVEREEVDVGEVAAIASGTDLGARQRCDAQGARRARPAQQPVPLFERGLGKRQRDRAAVEQGARGVDVFRRQRRGGGVAGGDVAPAAVGVLEADREQRRPLGHHPDEVQVHAGSRHLPTQAPAGLVAPHAAHRHHVEGRLRRPGAQQHRRVVRDDVQLAVVADVEQPRGPALLAAEVVLALEREDEPAADPAHAQQPPVGRLADPQRPGRDHSSSHSGCSAIGWRAVSSVAVINASG